MLSKPRLWLSQEGRKWAEKKPIALHKIPHLCLNSDAVMLHIDELGLQSPAEALSSTPFM